MKIRSVLLAATAVLTMIVAPVPLAGAAQMAGCTIPTVWNPVGKTSINSTPKLQTRNGVQVSGWAQTDGNVLAGHLMTFNNGVQAVAIGGNFTKITQPDGKVVPARNLAVVRVLDGTVIYGAQSLDGYVRAFASYGRDLYLAGNFKTVNGKAHPGIALLSTTSWEVSGWKPLVSGNTVRSIQVTASTVYFAGNGRVQAVRRSDGVKVWDLITDNVVRTLLLNPSGTLLYAGGFFDVIGGVPVTHLARITLSTGKVDPSWKPVLARNTGIGDRGAWDGDNPGVMTWFKRADGVTNLIVGGVGTQSIRSFSTASSNQRWGYTTEADTQGLAVVGNTIAIGFHRKHGNVWTQGCQIPFFGAQFTGDEGWLDPWWDPYLSGNETSWSVASQSGGGGIGAIVTDPVNRKVIVLGDFQKWGASCNLDTLACTGGLPMRGAAIYDYS